MTGKRCRSKGRLTRENLSTTTNPPTPDNLAFRCGGAQTIWMGLRRRRPRTRLADSLQQLLPPQEVLYNSRRWLVVHVSLAALVAVSFFPPKPLESRQPPAPRNAQYMCRQVSCLCHKSGSLHGAAPRSTGKSLPIAGKTADLSETPFRNEASPRRQVLDTPGAAIGQNLARGHTAGGGGEPLESMGALELLDALSELTATSPPISPARGAAYFLEAFVCGLGHAATHRRRLSSRSPVMAESC